MPAPARRAPAALAPLLLALLILAVSPDVRAQGLSLQELLPGHATDHDPKLVKPEDIFGWPVGTWHVEPDQLLNYFDTLARVSERVSIQRYAASHEGRALALAAITSPANQARLEELREAHVQAVRDGTPPAAGDPLVVWLGYSVHGNEPSGSNAASVVAWHLAASNDPEVEALLERTIVLIDPTLNPDGLNRFATWVNTQKGKQLVDLSSSREHREPWPGGRTNHYWFDLNRDWLLLAHPESRGRVAQYHRWLPNVLTDHHEMGTKSTFFFQPGVPSRRNPNTPVGNHELTRAIAEHHAAALDRIGQAYYSEERFDDFYYGKGSTYPDVNGSVGILFEQASSRGHLQEGLWGPLPFGETIRNQVVTSLSSLEGADALRDELLSWQREFGELAMSEARSGDVAAWVFGLPHDPARVAGMRNVLRQHQIEVYGLAADVERDGQTFRAGEAFIVPAVQRQARLARALFERRFEFEDPVFYDVSAWTLPLAFDVHDVALPVGEAVEPLLGARDDVATVERGSIETSDDAVAWLLPWDQLGTPRAVARLLREGVQLAVAGRGFTADGPEGPREYAAGTVIVPTRQRDVRSAVMPMFLSMAAQFGQLHVRVATSGFTAAGIDLGSPHVHRLEQVKPLLLTGSGSSSLRAGELWHLLDAVWELPTALVDGTNLDRGSLDSVSHVILPGSVPSGLGEGGTERLAEWVRAGGALIAVGSSACGWAERELLGMSGDEGLPPPPSDPEDKPMPGPNGGVREPGEVVDGTPARQPYAEHEARRAETLIGGAIFEVELDLTHPLAFGFRDASLPVFRQGSSVLRRTDDPFAQAGLYAAKPLLAGFAAQGNTQRIGGTPAATAQRVGRGVVIRLADAPWFRGAWPGSARLMANALFQSVAIQRTGPIGADDAAHVDEEQH